MKLNMTARKKFLVLALDIPSPHPDGVPEAVLGLVSKPKYPEGNIRAELNSLIESK